MKIINTGIDPNHWKKENHSEKDYYVGGVIDSPDVFSDSHGWEDPSKMPKGEYQCKNDDDKMCCVTMSNNSSCEFQGIRLDYNLIFNIPEFNISDRALAKMSGTTHNGNSPQVVCETMRKKGFTWENVWPYPGPMSWNEYYSAIKSSVINNCALNRDKVDYKHFWVDMNPAAIMSALKKGLVQAIGYAWQADQHGIYRDYGNTPNHAFLIFGHSKEGSMNNDGVWVPTYWIVYDSYTFNFQYDENDTIPTDFIKKLDGNFKFGDYGKLIVFRVKDNTEVKKKTYLALLQKSMSDFYYYWDDKGHHFFYIGKPFGIEEKFYQEILWSQMTTEVRFVFLSLRKGMNQSSWAEVSKFRNILDIGKKFA